MSQPNLMETARNTLEHDIWVAAYLTALRASPPDVAEQCAADAVKRYHTRWGLVMQGE